MDVGEDDGSGNRPETDTTADSMAAAKPSPDSPARSSGRTGRKRRVKTAMTSPDSGKPLTGSVRVLRARGAGTGRTTELETVTSKSKPARLHRGRGRPSGSRTRNTSAMQTPIKKSTVNIASKPSPKLSKSRKGKGRRPARLTTPAPTCKAEAEAEVLSSGEDPGAMKGSKENVADPEAAFDRDPPLKDDPNDLIYKPDTKTERSRHRAKLRQKEVKEEESEKEKVECGVKTEESPEIVVQREDGMDDNTEPTRKRGRRDDKAPRQPKRRKKPPVQYVRCEMEGCGTVLAHPRYLQHHIKYQHLLKKKYVCDHPSCGRLFRLQKQLLRHAKHHTDQRDYICEYCARAFKSSHNLAVHRMIHTGEKPIQCEICGFTCRQKASLNWHMKKHDAEASYQFSCSICGKKFEKKDSVIAHKAKSHPEVLIAEALAANGGSVISSPTTVAQPEQPSVSQETPAPAGGLLTPLQQVVLPLTPQTQLDVPPQGQFLQLPTHHVLQVAHQQQQQQQQPAPTLLHLTTAAPAHLSGTSHPQLIQLSTIPASTVASVPCTDSQSTLLTLSSVTTLASAASLVHQQAVHWGRAAEQDAQIPGEGELWERVVVGEGSQDVGEIMWEAHGESRKESEGIVWEREGERPILLQPAEVHGDNLI